VKSVGVDLAVILLTAAEEQPERFHSGPISLSSARLFVEACRQRHPPQVESLKEPPGEPCPVAHSHVASPTTRQRRSTLLAGERKPDREVIRCIIG
jgi:hypothetical protein